MFGLLFAKHLNLFDMNWHVYIIESYDQSFYTGITTDIDRRFEQHAEGKGAKYFNGRNPVKVVFREDGHTRSSASKREAEIKKLTKKDKIKLIENSI